MRLCVMQELVALRGEKKYSNHAHETGSWNLSGALFKISDGHPRLFYIGGYERVGKICHLGIT